MDAEPGSKVTFDEVLLTSDGETVVAGTPTVKGAKVVAEIVRYAGPGELPSGVIVETGLMRADAEAQWAIGDAQGAIERLRAAQRLARSGGQVSRVWSPFSSNSSQQNDRTTELYQLIGTSGCRDQAAG